MGTMTISQNKVLKLQNVLFNKVNLKNEEVDYNLAVEKMQSYIKVKGAMQVGPLIQQTKTFVNDDEKIDVEITFLLQCNNFIHNVEVS